MLRNIILSQTILSFIFTYCICQLNSPCPNAFQYDGVESNESEWTGKIILKTETPLHGIVVDIRLNNRASTLINWFGQSTTKDNQLFTIADINKTLKPGEELIVKILVRYNATTAPTIESVKLNGRTLCNIGNVLQQDIVSPVTEDVTIKTSVKATDEECGKLPLMGQPFIRKGQQVNESWPWHLAIYNSNGTDSSYICGGTLISENYVLTAAHCLTELGTENPKNVDNLLLFLGTNHLQQFGPYVQIRQAVEIHVHPNYYGKTFYNDIGILKLRNSVQLNEYVWPVCLWDEDLRLNNYVGQIGTVVGWGRDETNQLSPHLLKLNIPIVSLPVCLHSDRLFFATYLTENNYCAGYRNGSTVCSGDSGGGMFFEKHNKPGTWHLRGIVSVGAVIPGTLDCHPKHYSIFTDVSKYLDWINKIVR